nr:putative disease resistance protein RGA3 [Ipomoea batatas]
MIYGSKLATDTHNQTKPNHSVSTATEYRVNVTMADSIISGVVEQVITIINDQVVQELRAALGVEKEIKNLSSKLNKIKAVLNDAEKRSFNEEIVKLWVDEIKDLCYDVEDVLDEWITRSRRQQMERDKRCCGGGYKSSKTIATSHSHSVKKSSGDDCRTRKVFQVQHSASRLGYGVLSTAVMANHAVITSIEQIYFKKQETKSTNELGDGIDLITRRAGDEVNTHRERENRRERPELGDGIDLITRRTGDEVNE